jgi:biotin transport system substrate-specific component
MSVKLQTAAMPRTLLDTLAATADMRGAIRVASVVLLAGLTAAAAQVTIPWTPVPLTLTPMIVLLGGAALGSRLGMASQVLYLLAGIAGLPVFAASGILPPGPLRLLGPTGGYLLAYPLAAFVTGYLAERGFDRRYLTSVVAMLAGLSIIFAVGVAWLAFIAVPAPLGLPLALQTGLYPFVLVDLVKVCVAAAILPAVWAVIGRRDQDASHNSRRE